MDPLSAFELAANILTFIDFSYKVFASTSEIVRSGTTEGNRDLNTLIGDIRNLSEGLSKHVVGVSEHDVALRTLAIRCQEISKELEGNLDKLRVHEGSSRIKSLAVAIRSMYKKQGISDRMRTLDQYRSQILLRLVSMLSERQVTVQLQIEHIQSEMKRGNLQLVKKLENLNLQIQTLQQAKDPPRISDQLEGVAVFQPLKEALNQVLKQSVMPTPEIRVLKQLYFNSIYYREDQVEDASDNTFTWLLDDKDFDSQLDWAKEVGMESSTRPSDAEQQQKWEAHLENAHQRRSDSRTALLTWFSAENGVFHISGRAGSGKSTLMKTIHNHARTRHELDLWAGDKQLVLGHFFFYRAGTTESRSLEGLYRSILFETLLQQPALIPEVFPEAYSAFKRSTTMNSIDEIFFRTPRLKRAIDNLIECSSENRYRFCLLIDGLDEFGESNTKPEEYRQLAERLVLWSRMPNFKVLVSSRPYDEFMSTFTDQRRIHLHELNELDILQFGLHRFEHHRCFAQIQDYYRPLLKKVSERANGIFLWASLVISQLLHKLLLGEDVSALEKQLDDTPQDITELYHRMLNSIEPRDFDKALGMFWMVICYTLDDKSANLPLIAITWVDNLFDDQHFPGSRPIKTYSAKEIEERQRSAALQLNYYTKGLLEIQSQARWGQEATQVVVFLHRTVYDFIQHSAALQHHLSSYANLSNVSTKIRLSLAELWFQDTPRAFEASSLLHMSGKFWNKLIKEDQDQAHIWLNEYKRIINYHVERGSESFPGLMTDLRGSAWDIATITSMETDLQHTYRNIPTSAQMSWLHWMLFELEDNDFIITRLKDTPRLSGDEELSPLLSAACRNLMSLKKRTRLMRYLLQNGASPNERIIARYKRFHISATVWQLFCVALAQKLVVKFDGELQYQPYMPMLDTLEQLLQTGIVDTDVLILLRILDFDTWKEEGDREFDEQLATHAISLFDLIRQRMPRDSEHWTKLFKAGNKNSRSWLQASWQSLIMSRPRPLRHTFAKSYVPYTIDMELPEAYRNDNVRHFFTLRSIVFGNTVLPADKLRVRVF